MITPSPELLKMAIQAWGEEAQIKMAIEECSELIVALLHNFRGKSSPEEVAGEIADVVIMAHQLALMLGPDLVDREIRRKLVRLAERLAA